MGHSNIHVPGFVQISDMADWRLRKLQVLGATVRAIMPAYTNTKLVSSHQQAKISNFRSKRAGISNSLLAYVRL